MIQYFYKTPANNGCILNRTYRSCRFDTTYCQHHCSKTSFKLGIPTLIFFLAIGMLAGSEGIGHIYFDDPHTAQVLGVVALNIILFSGGIDTRWESIRPVLRQGISLYTIGVVFTAATIGVFVHLITDFTPLEGLLLKNPQMAEIQNQKSKTKNLNLIQQRMFRIHR
jgi:Sodium/hydrogen exchanger family